MSLQIRQSPETGDEELVVVGGYSTRVLAEMKAFPLDLETLVWHCWEGVEPVPADASGPSQSAAAPVMPRLPEPRQRMAAQRISHDWLLISGGSPASVRTASLARSDIVLTDSRRLVARCNRVESHGRQDPCYASADCPFALHSFVVSPRQWPLPARNIGCALSHAGELPG